MESTRPIRALMRGLDALTVLNMRDGATVSEVAHEIRLPRTTVYRILETLCNAGFVFRDAADDRYRLTIQVRALSEGFVDEAWVTQIAKPLITELSREIGWPVSIATLSGTAMRVREPGRYSRAGAELERTLAEIRASGYATATRTRRRVEEHSVSVPILMKTLVLASLTVRFTAASVPLQKGLEQFLPELRRCAAEIGSLLSEQQVEARKNGAPQATA
jgi:DNA-binding IclR family transcriptional regulator